MFGTVLNNLSHGNNSPLTELFPDEHTEISSGMGFMALMAAVVFRSMGLMDVMRLMNNDLTVISSGRNAILRTVIDSVLDGNSRPSPEDLDSIANRLSLSRESIEQFMDGADDIVQSVRGGIDIVSSLMELDRSHIRNALNAVLNRQENDQTFAEMLHFQALSYFDRLVSLAHIATDGREDGFEQIFIRVMNNYSEDRNNDMMALLTAGQQAVRNTIRNRFPNGVSIIDSLRAFLVRVQSQPTVTPVLAHPSTSTLNLRTLPASTASQSINEDGIRSVFPEDWATVIIEDINRQNNQQQSRRNNTSFSDAYNLGINSRRRNVIIPRNATEDQFIADALHTTLTDAMDSAGITNASEILKDVEMTEEVAGDFSQEMDKLIEQRLKREADYEPEKFPNIKKRFNPNPDRDEAS